jgi:CheY-like chemotaxis protein
MAEVLVIDDDPHMRDLLTRFLERDRLSVAVAANGETGLHLARELRPTAILLDVMMPRMDGWAVLSALKADPLTTDIPVIMISMIRDKGLAYSLGAAEYLTKPVDWSRLKTAIDRHRSQPGPGWAVVAEPDPATRAELRSLLISEGWEVAEASDSAAAQVLTGGRRPDLLLVNIERTEIEAFKLLRELRRTPQGREVPVLALTEGTLDPIGRERLSERVRQVVQIDKDGMDELLEEIRAIAMERRIQKGDKRNG